MGHGLSPINRRVVFVRTRDEGSNLRDTLAESLSFGATLLEGLLLRVDDQVSWVVKIDAKSFLPQTKVHYFLSR